MSTFVFDNFIGQPVSDIKEAVNGISAGMDFLDRDGNSYKWMKEDDDGNEIEPTEKDVLERISTDLNDGYNVYMGIYIDLEKYNIVPAKAVTLQSDFHLGQKVYTMIDNKIKEVRIIYLSLSHGDLSSSDFSHSLSDVTRNLYYTIGFAFYNQLETYVPSDKEKIIKEAIKKFCMGNQVIATYSVNHTTMYGHFPMDEVFATKEELAKHLMESE